MSPMGDTVRILLLKAKFPFDERHEMLNRCKGGMPAAGERSCKFSGMLTVSLSSSVPQLFTVVELRE